MPNEATLNYDEVELLITSLTSRLQHQIMGTRNSPGPDYEEALPTVERLETLIKLMVSAYATK